MNIRNPAKIVWGIAFAVCLLTQLAAEPPLPTSMANNSTLGSLSTKQLQSDLAKLREPDESAPQNRALLRQYRVELAKRGDTKCRAEIFAAMQSGDLAEQSNALEDVAALADGEAIARLAGMLFDPNNGGRYTRDHAFLPPRIVAAMKLAQIVRNPPVPPIGPLKKFYTDEDVLKWRKWWTEEGSKGASTP